MEILVGGTHEKDIKRLLGRWERPNLYWVYPLGGKSVLMTARLIDQNQSFKEASADFRFASAVAIFALALKIARESTGQDPQHKRQEFIQLLESAQKLK